MANVLCIIPARGGSKGIPRKNLRPMAGKPLIYYSIRACLSSERVATLVVSTDDEEIALFARRFGAEVLMRPAELADDARTLDPVIHHALLACEAEQNRRFDIVLTVQPTSPLLEPADIDRALAMFEDGDLDTVLSVVDDRHLCWTLADDQPVPEYTQRVNRQQLPPRFRETGAIIACRRAVLADTGSRIGESVALLEVEQEKSFDIDTISDFKLCESLLLRRTVVFNVIGNSEVGMGHVYRALMIAHEMVGHNLVFLCSEDDRLAAEFVRERNFDARVCAADARVDAIRELRPDLLVNDVLDTDTAFMQAARSACTAIVNFEDLGPGIVHADLVINALYPTADGPANVRSGPEFFCLREEFLHLAEPPPDSPSREVLLCFGGVDEGNLSLRVLQAIYQDCRDAGIRIVVVLGPGYAHHAAIDAAVAGLDPAVVALVRSTPVISEYMQRAEFAITSGGRTVLELAALQTPTIVICQNAREETHAFTPGRLGVINLGNRSAVTDEAILDAFRAVAGDARRRQAMADDLADSDLRHGKQRVMALLNDLLTRERP